jgi:enamine deaminase RidA (YjgF/YER057c/UK114 family)
MRRRVIRPTGHHRTTGYSHAIIKHGVPVFLAGQVALDPDGNLVGEGDVGAQAAQVLANIKSAVTACGGTMDDVVKITVFTTDLAHRPAIAEARQRHFRPGHYPASTFLVVSSLADPRFLVEIEAVAMIDSPTA